MSKLTVLASSSWLELDKAPNCAIHAQSTGGALGIQESSGFMFNGCEFGQRAGRKRAQAAGSLCEVLRGKVLLEENKEPVVTAGPG